MELGAERKVTWICVGVVLGGGLVSDGVVFKELP